MAIDVHKTGVSASVSGADIHIDKTGVSASVSGADIHIDKTGVSASVSRTADINVDKTGVSASASAAGVDATASVELREPQDTRISIKVPDEVVGLKTDKVKNLVAGVVEE